MSAPDRSDLIRRLFEEAVGLPPGDRADHLAASCGNDAELRREVEALLESADAEALEVRQVLEALRPTSDESSGSTSPPDLLELPTRLREALSERYALKREIGHGGMATVYLAEDHRHHRKVAVKVLDADLAATIGADRFLREIETAANLTHPHILPLHDSGDAGGFLYYVMPFVKGESLRARLDREVQLSVDEAVSITREISDALAYAHERGVIHRDVKPANILLEAGHAVLADFGVAKAAADADRTMLTHTGTALGTPAYMSPEQASGERSLDGRSDQYALACVLYEMLGGEPPFRGGRAEAIVRQHLLTQPPPVTQARPSVPEATAGALHRALAKNPADRFPSTRDFAATLAESLQAAAGGFKEGGRTTPKAPRRLVAIGAAIAVSILVVFIGAWATMSRLGRQTDGARPEVRPAAGVAESVAEILNRQPGIAVLPFANRSDVSADEYFTEGFQDDLLTRLQRIPGLRVISRTSSEAYRDSDKTVSVIGRELGVVYLLEGSVQRAGDQVHIGVQLIDARTEDHIWADTYDRVLTTENLFDMQSEIVRTVAGELNVELRQEERLKAARRTTRDLAAYDLYVRGRFQEAVDRDPGFVAAQVALVRNLAHEYQVNGLRDEGRAAAARAAAERAVRLAPELEDVQLAMGLYLYRVEKDWEGALDWLQRASGTLVGDFEYHHFRGLVERRAGRWGQAVASLEAALALSPRSAACWVDLGTTYIRLRRYAQAEAALLEAQRLGDLPVRRFSELAWFRDGTTDAYDPYLKGDPANRFGWEILMTEGRYEDALEYLQSEPDVLFGQFWWYPKPLLEGETLEALGRISAATEKRMLAVNTLEPLAERTPEDERYHASLSWAYAGLGIRDDAVREARRALEIMPPRRDAMNGPFFLLNLASIYARLGQEDEALAVLEELLSLPSRHPVTVLEDHFRLRPLQDSPRFQALMNRERDRVF